VPRTVSLRQVAIAVGAFVALVIVGTIGFVLLLDDSLFDALFRTVNTIYTAGLFDAPESTGADLHAPGSSSAWQSSCMSLRCSSSWRSVGRSAVPGANGERVGP
jgi:hypothetical protein